MIKLIVCFVGWLLLPVAILVVAFDVVKTWVEAKMMV
jgi:hypothetical protein